MWLIMSVPRLCNLAREDSPRAGLGHWDERSYWLAGWVTAGSANGDWAALYLKSAVVREPAVSSCVSVSQIATPSEE